MAIGTAAMIGMGLASMGAQTASNVYGARSAARENKRAIEAQSASEMQAMALERERMHMELQAQQAAEQRQAMAQQQQWEAYKAAQQPRWNMGYQAANALASQLGLEGNMQMPNELRPYRGGPPGRMGDMQAMAEAARWQTPPQGPSYGGVAPPQQAPPVAGGGPGVVAQQGYRRRAPLPPQATAGMGQMGDMARMAQLTGRY